MGVAGLLYISIAYYMQTKKRGRGQGVQIACNIAYVLGLVTKIGKGMIGVGMGVQHWRGQVKFLPFDQKREKEMGGGGGGGSHMLKEGGGGGSGRTSFGVPGSFSTEGFSHTEGRGGGGGRGHF